MLDQALKDGAHRRFNPLTGEWVLVSPHRTQRPWQGREETDEQTQRPGYDPGCYLCPGNNRAGGERNPAYDSTFTFVNDYSAIPDDDADPVEPQDPLFRARRERGICKVVCFSPRHDLTLPELDPASVEEVVRTWQSEYLELGAREFIRHVQIFENKGSLMGCSNPHPHGQIWAQSSIPDIPAREDRQQKAYRDEHGRLLLSDYLEAELRDGERVVAENERFATVVPFWAVWPFETMIIPKAARPDIGGLEANEVAAFAEILRVTTAKYDNLFTTSFPYSAGIHQRPTDGGDYDHWCWHMHFYPPLLRSAQVKKFMVGYEMLAEPQRDITPEQSAKLLRELPAEHYSMKQIDKTKK